VRDRSPPAPIDPPTPEEDVPSVGSARGGRARAGLPRAEILKQLVQAHADVDEVTFRKAALQLAATESSAGHVRVAEDLRAIVAGMAAATTKRGATLVDIAQPRGELADVLEGGHREERLPDIVLSDETRATFVRLLQENRSRAKLEKWGVLPRRRLLFQGPPGCGKTLAAAVVAGEMGLPLLTVRLDALFSRFLGATATHLRAIFAEMPRRPGVYLFDEFDAVAKARGDAQDVGEMNRVVTAFLQLIDADVSGSLLIAATNHAALLDRAVFRRFDLIVPFEKPAVKQVAALLRLRLAAFDLAADLITDVARIGAGLSFAAAAMACDNAIRTMVLDGREHIRREDLERALEEATRRDLSRG
jgi:AAA+ superfamily predicted ATPase